jgi:hypothetical protein
MKNKTVWLIGAAVLAYLLYTKAKATPVVTPTLTPSITTTVDTPMDVTYG